MDKMEQNFSFWKAGFPKGWRLYSGQQAVGRVGKKEVLPGSFLVLLPP